MKKLLVVLALLASTGSGRAAEGPRPHMEGPHEGRTEERESPERREELAKAREQRTAEAKAKLAISLAPLIDPVLVAPEGSLDKTMQAVDALYPDFDAEMVKRIQAEHRPLSRITGTDQPARYQR